MSDESALEEIAVDQPLLPRLGVIIPLFVAAFALAGNFYSERNNRNARTQLAKDTFELKVADIVMDTQRSVRDKASRQRDEAVVSTAVGGEFCIRV